MANGGTQDWAGGVVRGLSERLNYVSTWISYMKEMRYWRLPGGTVQSGAYYEANSEVFSEAIQLSALIGEIIGSASFALTVLAEISGGETTLRYNDLQNVISLAEAQDTDLYLLISHLSRGIKRYINDKCNCEDPIDSRIPFLMAEAVQFMDEMGDQ